MISITRQKERSIPRVQPDGGYLVDSATVTLVAYNVHNGEHGWQCDCPAGALYRTCWHVTAVLALEAANLQEADLAADLAAISEFLQDGGGDDTPPAPAKAKRQVPDRRRWSPRPKWQPKPKVVAPQQPMRINIPAKPTQVLYYRSGARKPYVASDSHVARVRKSQESWSFDDGEVA